MSQSQRSVKLCLTLSAMNSGNNRQIDQKGKAIYNYEKFLELWKDAGPGIAEVDAREMLIKIGE